MSEEEKREMWTFDCVVEANCKFYFDEAITREEAIKKVEEDDYYDMIDFNFDYLREVLV